MKGHPNQELLALYAGGDLTLNQEDAKHLEACRVCQTVVADLRGTRELLLTLSEPSDAELQSMRSALNGRIQKLQRKTYLAWIPAPAVLAVALTLVLTVKHRPAPQKLVPPIQAPALAVAEPPAAPAVKAIPIRRRSGPKAGIRSVTLLARQDGPSQLKLTTADPNVVILLQMKEEVNNQ